MLCLDIVDVDEVRKQNYALIVKLNGKIETYFSKSDLDLLEYANFRKFDDYEIFELIEKKLENKQSDKQ